MTHLLNIRLPVSPPRQRPKLRKFGEPQLRGVIERERAHFAREAGVNPRMASPATEDYLAQSQTQDQGQDQVYFR